MTLSRIVGVTTEAVCEVCRRQILCTTCSVCGKHRQRYALKEDGKPLCKSCAAFPNAQHKCPDCGTTIGGAGNNACFACSIVRAVRRKATKALDGLLREDIRVLFSEFMEWAIEKKLANKITGRIFFFADLLAQIERSMPVAQELTPNVITSALTTEEIRRAGYLTIFLAERGLIVSTARERAVMSEQRRIVSAIAEAQWKPWGGAIKEYAQHLASSAAKLGKSTQRSYLRAAIELMKTTRIDEVQELNEAHLVDFLSEKPGHRASLSRWLSFIAGTTGHVVRLPTKRTRKSQTLHALVPEVEKLIHVATTTTSATAKRSSVVKLISVLYGLPVSSLLELDGNCLEVSEDGVHLLIQDVWVRLAAPADALLLEVISWDNTAAKTGPLFLGRLRTDALSPSAIYRQT